MDTQYHNNIIKYTEKISQYGEEYMDTFCSRENGLSPPQPVAEEGKNERRSFKIARNFRLKFETSATASTEGIKMRKFLATTIALAILASITTTKTANACYESAGLPVRFIPAWETCLRRPTTSNWFKSYNESELHQDYVRSFEGCSRAVENQILCIDTLIGQFGEATIRQVQAHYRGMVAQCQQMADRDYNNLKGQMCDSR